MESMCDFDSLQERHKHFWDVAKMEGNYMKIATRWCSFEEKKINNLQITAFLKQIFVWFLLILICTPTLFARPFRTDNLSRSNGKRFYLNGWQPFEWIKIFFKRIAAAVWTTNNFSKQMIQSIWTATHWSQTDDKRTANGKWTLFRHSNR